jgi:hypothetical protein
LTANFDRAILRLRDRRSGCSYMSLHGEVSGTQFGSREGRKRLSWPVVSSGVLVRVRPLGAAHMRAAVREAPGLLDARGRPPTDLPAAAMDFFLRPSVQRDKAREIRPSGCGDLAAPRR